MATRTNWVHPTERHGILERYIIKYAARAGFKNYDGQDSTSSEITDLRKVMRYAEMRIEEIQRKELENEEITSDDSRSFIERDLDSLRGWDIPS